MAPAARPIVTIVMLVGLFMALGALLTVLSVVAALGGGGAAFAFWGCRGARSGVRLAGRSKQEGGRGAKWRPASGPRMPSRLLPQRGQAKQSRPAAFPAVERSSPPARTAPQPTGAAPRRPRRVGEAAALPIRIPPAGVSYRRKIQSLIKSRRPGPIAERMSGVLQKLTSWEERVGQLADRLTLYEGDDLIQRDVREVPGHIARLGWPACARGRA